MSWTYNSGNLGTTTATQRVNTVRFLVGDTDRDDQQVQNEEITFALTASGDNVYEAAAFVANTLAASYARKANVVELDAAIRYEYADRRKTFLQLSRDLKKQAQTAGASLGVKAGGISKATVESVRSLTDRPKPSFTRDRFRDIQDGDSEDYYNENY